MWKVLKEAAQKETGVLWHPRLKGMADAAPPVTDDRPHRRRRAGSGTGSSCRVPAVLDVNRSRTLIQRLTLPALHARHAGRSLLLQTSGARGRRDAPFGLEEPRRSEGSRLRGRPRSFPWRLDHANFFGATPRTLTAHRPPKAGCHRIYEPSAVVAAPGTHNTAMLQESHGHRTIKALRAIC